MDKRIRVLVADDSAVIRRLVADALHVDPEFEVYPAIHGREAVELVPHVQPHLVVMNVVMPVMDGVEAVRLIRETNRELPIILLCRSLDANSETTLAALAAGANDYVTKAIRIGHVGAAIQYIRSQLIPKIRYWTQPRVDSFERSASDAAHEQECACETAHSMVTVIVDHSDIESSELEMQRRLSSDCTQVRLQKTESQRHQLPCVGLEQGAGFLS